MCKTFVALGKAVFILLIKESKVRPLNSSSDNCASSIKNKLILNKSLNLNNSLARSGVKIKTRLCVCFMFIFSTNCKTSTFLLPSNIFKVFSKYSAIKALDGTIITISSVRF